MNNNRKFVAYDARFRNKGLDVLNMILLTEIENLSKLEKGCYATDKQLGELILIGEKSTNERIKYIESLGYIICNTSFIDGKRRRSIQFIGVNTPKGGLTAKRMRKVKTPQGGLTNTPQGVSHGTPQGGNNMLLQKDKLKKTPEELVLDPDTRKKKEKEEIEKKPVDPVLDQILDGYQLFEKIENEKISNGPDTRPNEDSSQSFLFGNGNTGPKEEIPTISLSSGNITPEERWLVMKRIFKIKEVLNELFSTKYRNWSGMISPDKFKTLINVDNFNEIRRYTSDLPGEYSQQFEAGLREIERLRG